MDGKIKCFNFQQYGDLSFDYLINSIETIFELHQVTMTEFINS